MLEPAYGEGCSCPLPDAVEEYMGKQRILLARLVREFDSGHDMVTTATIDEVRELLDS